MKMNKPTTEFWTVLTIVKMCLADLPDSHSASRKRRRGEPFRYLCTRRLSFSACG